MADIIQIVMHDGTWARSEFPHPLITMDYDADGRLLAVSGPADRVRVYGDAIIDRINGE